MYSFIIVTKDVSGMIFNERLKYLRQSKELNQVQLADKLGVKKQSISNWENDNIMPSVDMLERIADYFKVRATPHKGKNVI